MTTTTDRKTITEISEAVTGYDELAVRKHMETDLYEAMETSPVLWSRCLIFVDRRHQGDSDVEAKKFAMSASVKAVNDHFAEDDDLDPDQPETPAGEGV